MARLDRRIQFRRATVRDDGFQTGGGWNLNDPAADDLGGLVWAGREEGAGTEGSAGGGIQAALALRFTVRSSPFTRAIKPTDRLVEGGTVFEIIGITEIGRRNLLVISVQARVD